MGSTIKAFPDRRYSMVLAVSTLLALAGQPSVQVLEEIVATDVQLEELVQVHGEYVSDIEARPISAYDARR